MKTLKKLWHLLPALLLWLMLSVFFWGWIFTFLTDAPAQNKLTLFVDAPVTDATGLAVQLEEGLLNEHIRMVKVHPFTYAMLDGEPLRTADVYIVRAGNVQEYREWFAPLPDGFADAVSAAPEDVLTLDGVALGVRIRRGGEDGGVAAGFVDYRQPGLPEEDFYLMLGKASLHLPGNEAAVDTMALRLAERLLLIP